MKISNSAKRGYLRSFDLFAFEKQKLNRFKKCKICTTPDSEAIRKDWMEVGNEIRRAEQEYRYNIRQ